MTETQRETAGAVRSAHVAHFFAPDWLQTAQRASAAVERADRALSAPQIIVTVPDASSAAALGRELRALPASVGLRVLPITSAARGARLLKASPAAIVVGTPTVLAELLAASALRLGDVHTVLLAAADEYEPHAAELAALMAELPRGCDRILTAAGPTPFVENLLERYLHKCRRITEPAAAPVTIAPGTPPTISVRTVASAAVLAALGEVLDDIDPPSAAIVVADSRGEGQARTALEALGYSAGSELVQVTRGDVALHTALVVFAGLPTTDALGKALDAHPARLVALVPPRQREALRARALGVLLTPYEHSRSARAAREHERGVRSALRSVLAAGLPAREVAALEPLLAEYDGLEIAGAALRLYERAAEEAAAARLAGREELRAELKAARAEPKRPDAAERPAPRRFERDAPRGERSRPPREGREGREGRDGRDGRDGRERRESRSSDGPRASGGPPRGGSRPFGHGARSDRASAPANRGPHRDDKGRPPRKNT